MLAEFMIVTIEDGNFKYKAYFQNRDMRACVRTCVRACVHVCRTHVRACVRARGPTPITIMHKRNRHT